MEVFQPLPQISAGFHVAAKRLFYESRVRVKTHVPFARVKKHKKLEFYLAATFGPAEASFAKRILILKVDHFFMKIAKSG